MKPGAFNFDPDVDMRQPAIGQAPSGVIWAPAEAPIAHGKTPAARHASATGAMAAAPKIAGRAKQLLVWFLKADSGRLTLDQARVLLGVPVNCVTGPWSKLEALGWIEGLSEFLTYKTASGRQVSQEYHRLTVAGRAIALELQQRGGAR